MNEDFNALKITDFLTLLDSFLDVSNMLNQLLIDLPELNNEIDPWFDLYEISNTQLTNMAIQEFNAHQEAFEYIFSQDPIETIHKLANKDKTEDTNIDMDFVKAIRFIYPMIKTKECIFFYNQSIHQLLKKIGGGFDTNDNLLQHVISIDKTTINCKVIQKRIQQAQTINDEKFFRKIANALKPREKPKHSEDSTLRFMIYFLMDNGHLQAMSENDKYQNLKQFKSKHITKDTFIRKIYRIMRNY